MDHEETSYIFSGALWTLVAKGIFVVVQFAAVAIVARELGPGGFGIFSVVLSLVSLFVLFSDFGAITGTARLIAEGDKRQSDVILHGAGLIVSLTLVVSLVFFFFSSQISEILKSPIFRESVILVVGLLLVRILYKYQRKVFEALGRMDVFSRADTVLGPLPWIVPLAIVVLVSGTAVGALFGRLVGYATVVAALSLILLGHLAKSHYAPSSKSIDTTIIRRIATYSPAMLATALSLYIFSESDILLVQFFLGSEQVGIYSLAVKLVAVLQVPATAIGASVAAYFVGEAGESGPQESEMSGPVFLLTAKYVLALYLPTMLGLLMVGNELIISVFGPEYASSVIIVLVYLPVLLAKSFGTIYSRALDYLGYAGRRAVMVSVSAGLNIGLNLLLIPRYGIIGAAVATQVTLVPFVVWYIYMMTKITEAELSALKAPFLRILLGLGALAAMIVALQLLGQNAFLSALVGGVTYLTVILSLGVIDIRRVIRGITGSRN